MTILVIDDEDGTHMILRHSLAARPWDLIPERTLSGGLLAVPKYHPEVTLLDLTFPESRAMQTIGTIPSIAKQTCVIIITGDEGEGGMWDSCIEAGAMNFLQKSHYLHYDKSNVRSLLHAIWNSYLLHRKLYGVH